MRELRGWREQEIRKIKEGLSLMYDEFRLDCLKLAAPAAGTRNIRMAETGLEVVVRVECPEADQAALEVLVSQDRLNIVCRENSDAAREISLSLPVSVSPEQSQANLRSGVLIVRMPRKSRPAARSILISEGGQSPPIDKKQGRA